MRYVSKHAAVSLDRELSLGGHGQEQDWAVELADSTRLEEFIAEYGCSGMDDERDFAFASLIVASFDALIASRLQAVDAEYSEIFGKANRMLDAVYTAEELRLWRRVKDILEGNLPLFSSIIMYWANADDCGTPFASTLLFQESSKKWLRTDVS